MTEERKNELNKMIDTGDFDVLEKITDHDEQHYVIQQTVKACLDTYTVKDERSYAKHVFKMLHVFRTNDVAEMLKYLEDIKQLPRELLPEDIMRRIDQFEKIKDMDAEEMNELSMEGVNMIKTLIDNIMTVYEEHEILFNITKIAIDLHVYTDKGTILRARITTPEIEEAYAKHNS